MDPSDPWRYDGQRVVVTGCSSGIGHAVAEEVTHLGAVVTGMDLRPPRADIQFVDVDLADASSIDEAVAKVDQPVDALFNCAGISGAFPARQVLGVNFIGLRHLTERLLDRMPDGSSIANVSSTGGAAWERFLPLVHELAATSSAEAAYQWCDEHAQTLETHAYNVSKSAVIYYTMSQAVPLAARQIRINAIGPAATETPFLDATRRRLGDAALQALPRPLGRFARAEEQARVLVFLNSCAASYVTGENIWVDGGFVAGARTGTIDGSFLGVAPVTTGAQEVAT